MKENSPVSQLGNFVDRPCGVSEIGGNSGHVHWLDNPSGYATVLMDFYRQVKLG